MLNRYRAHNFAIATILCDNAHGGVKAMDDELSSLGCNAMLLPAGPANTFHLSNLVSRHNILENGLLHPGRISREVARLFPKERAGEIMAWYQRLVVGLTEMKRVKELEAFSLNALGNFIMDYPGPDGDDMDDMVSIRSTGRKIGQAVSDTGSARGRLFDTSVSSVPSNYPSVKPKVVTKSPAMESSGRLGYDFRPGSNVPMARPTSNPLPYQDQGAHQLGLSKNVRDPRSYFSQGDYASASGGSDLETETDSGEIRGFEGMMREEILEEIGGYAERGEAD
jgi:hypothetical protein